VEVKPHTFLISFTLEERAFDAYCLLKVATCCNFRYIPTEVSGKQWEKTKWEIKTYGKIILK
jgi:hypothetical protein